MAHEPGEQPRNPNADEAKGKARKILDDPKHHKPKGSPEDLATTDGELPQPDDQ